MKEATTYDASGIATDTWDAAGAHSHVTRTAANGILNKITTTNPLGQVGTAVLEPAHGLTVASTDPNGITARSTYDGLGRLTAVWTNSRPTSQPANLKYSYRITNTGPSSVTTQTANDANGYAVATKLYDALLRPIQTQQPTPQGGRLLTNTFYDTHGWVWKANSPYWDPASAPNTTLAAADDAKIPNQTVTTLDGLGRAILTTSYYQSQPREQTATAYLGDKTITVPPPGGVATQTVTDAANRTTKVADYTTRPTVTVTNGTGTAPVTTVTITGGSTTASNDNEQAVTYGYDARGNQTDLTNQASGDTWHTDYDNLGRPVTKKDPDAGTTTLTYDQLGHVKQTTDANNATISFTYDTLGRKTGSFHGPTADPAKQIASWTYDNLTPDGQPDIPGLTNPIGHLTSSTRYDASGNTTVGGLTGKQRGYTTHVTDGYDLFGQPLASTVALPASEGALKGDHTVWHDYTSRAGLHIDDYYNGQDNGPLPEETVTYGWTVLNGMDLPGATNGDTGYASEVRYTAYGQVAQVKAGTINKPAFATYAYDDHTARLLDRQFTYTDRSTTPINEDRYAYDPAGNPTKQSTTRQGTQSETQCFAYDTLDRLTQAWTATDDCAADPSGNKGATVGSGILGGAYWTSWDLDPLGQRKSETRHGLAGNGDSVTTYKYAGSGNPQPHTLTSATIDTATDPTATPVTTQKQTFGYDKVGNTTQRTTLTNPGQPDQSTDDRALGWTDQGELSTVTTTNGGPSYLYDADGHLLLQKDPTAATTTLYLSNEQLTLNTTTGKTSGIRYYPQPGGLTSIRTVDATGTTKLTLETADPHGTGSFAIDTDWNQPTWRQTTPYGAPRGTKPTYWPDNHGFLGDVEDQTTGLTDIGARWYDPGLGRFASLDPLLAATSQQEQNGYTYAGGNPVSNSDPSGLNICNGGTGPDACAHNGNGTTQTPDGRTVPDPNCWETHTCGHSGNGNLRGGGHSTSTQHGITITVYVPKDFAAASRKMQIAWLESQVKWSSGVPGGSQIHDEYLAVLCSLYPEEHQLCAPMTDADRHEALGALGMVPGPVGWGATAINVTWYLSDGDWKHAALEGGLRVGLALAGKFFGRILGRLLADGCQSFTPGTLVPMADGTSKKIQDIKVGDKIKNAVPGVKPGTADQVHTVTAIHVTHTDRHYTDVTIEGAHGPKTIVGTSGHKYWDVTRHAWVPAQSLKAGERLQTTWGGSVRVLTTLTYSTTAVTYNLTVDGLHTYFVDAGDTPILVHNAACGPLVLGIGPHADKLTKEIEGAYNFNGPDYEQIIGQANGQPLAQWMANVTQALKDNSKVAVALDGFDGATPAEKFMKAYTNGVGKNWHATEWEMGQIGRMVQRGRLDWNNVTFYEGGKPVPGGIPKPEDW
ncbi:RHS repeat-associated core domain-containing protein [Actinomadura rupiterrae]|uniref:RHS repeat-associated core domain-containing protein n=1 Tax=Actinomadura rupiterrae TaxID=559627 RepID=UPI0020A29CA7|nr:RHS repeat-associated core domain-containing protein [Actinomadura rupiterrae]MCP2343166.1 RHS repeat-associated protein [Actinomadura rupiterrae]